MLVAAVHLGWVWAFALPTDVRASSTQSQESHVAAAEPGWSTKTAPPPPCTPVLHAHKQWGKCVGIGTYKVCFNNHRWHKHC